MEIISTLTSLCELARGGLGVLSRLRNALLTEREKELLRLAAQDGVFHIYEESENRSGYWVGVKGQSFRKDDDPAYQAQYLDAFRALCERGYVEHSGGIAFVLTGTGFEKARKLAAKG